MKKINKFSLLVHIIVSFGKHRAVLEFWCAWNYTNKDEEQVHHPNITDFIVFTFFLSLFLFIYTQVYIYTYIPTHTHTYTHM